MIFKEVLGLDSQLIEDRFGYMLEAFKYGAPPHGGIAFGLDRMVAILSKKENIREVIAFPKNQKGQELMTQSPSCVTKKQLNDVNVSILEKEGN